MTTSRCRKRCSGNSIGRSSNAASARARACSRSVLAGAPSPDMRCRPAPASPASPTRKCRRPISEGKLANFGDNFDIELTDFYEYQPKEKFDAIVIMGVIEHLPDYERVLKKFSALLKPGGRVFLDGSAWKKKYELSTFMVRHIYPGNHSFLVLDDFLNKMWQDGFRSGRHPQRPLELLSHLQAMGDESRRHIRTTSSAPSAISNSVSSGSICGARLTSSFTGTSIATG